MNILGQILLSTPRKNIKGDFTDEVIEDKMSIDFMPLFDVDKYGNDNLLCYEGTFHWCRKDKTYEMNVDAYIYANSSKEIVTVVSPLHKLPDEAELLINAVGFKFQSQIDFIKKKSYVNN